MTSSRTSRRPHTVVVGLLLGLMASIGVGPSTVPASPAEAAPYCNIYPPARFAVWSKLERLPYTLGAGCRTSFGSPASWDASYVGRGPGSLGTVDWSYEEELTGSFLVSQWGGLGRVHWVPAGDGRRVLQNEAWTSIKFGAVSYISARRVGGYHEVISRGYHWSTGLVESGVVPSGGRPGQLQFREPGSSTWRPVGGIRLERDGRSIVRTWSPGPRFYRVSFGEQPTLFDTISAEVEAR